MEKLFNLSLHRIGPLLRSNLADAAELAGGIDRLLTFPLAVREGLFDIDILARLHRPDSSQAVPVIAGRDHDRIDAVIGE